MLTKNIQKISPLHEYWSSQQTLADFSKILSIINTKNPASILLKEEPYKWEILFQSILNEINNGDKTAIKSLRILIDCLKEKEKNRLIQSLIENNLIKNESIYEKDPENSKSKKNMVRFIKILYAIFMNRFGINLKGEKNHIYEHTGMISYNIRSFFGLIK
tara:strand:+ start:33 stop:515 length:483 start_codon:yes stop_codon:yes gene_type:complete